MRSIWTKKLCPAIGVAAVVLSLRSSTLRADTHYVDLKSATPSAPFTSPETAAHQIQAAIDAAEQGDVVKVAAGSYKIAATIVVKLPITIEGAGAEETTIDAGGACQVVRLGKEATLIGLTITGGKARDGGGISCSRGTRIADCVIKDNVAERYGGGISARAQGPRQPRHKKKGDQTPPPEPCRIENCRIMNNRVTDFMHTDTPWGGGGIYAEGMVRVVGCTIENNEAAQRAGGIWCHGGDVVADRSTIRGNRALGKRKRNPNGSGSMEEGGGGAYCDFGGRLTSCLVLENSAPRIGGGAVLSVGGNVRNCTFVANRAGQSGGGIQTLGPTGIVNSIVVGNFRGLDEAAGEPDDVYVSHYYHVDVHQLSLGKASLKHSCLGATQLHKTNQRFYLGPTARYDPKWYKNTINETKPVVGDPKFASADEGDYRLAADSPCLDAGLQEKWMPEAKDFAGNPRLQGEAPDLGAYEMK